MHQASTFHELISQQEGAFFGLLPIPLDVFLPLLLRPVLYCTCSAPYSFFALAEPLVTALCTISTTCALSLP